VQGNDPLSETLKEEIWPNPMQVLTTAEPMPDEFDEEGEGEEVVEIDEDDEAEIQEYEEVRGSFQTSLLVTTIPLAPPPLVLNHVSYLLSLISPILMSLRIDTLVVFVVLSGQEKLD
jgi:hypothetical protein